MWFEWPRLHSVIAVSLSRLAPSLSDASRALVTFGVKLSFRGIALLFERTAEF